MQGQLLDISHDRFNGTAVHLSVDAVPEELEKLKGVQLDITLKKHRKGRSRDANALFWACVGDMAKDLGVDSWDIYLMMLERYGSYTTVNATPEAAETLKRVWREVKVVGERYDGTVDINCYYGSSKYNTQEMAILIDGTLSEMKEMGLTPPPTGEMKRALEAWNDGQGKNQKSPA